MAEDTVRRENGREVPAFATEATMADGIDASVDRMQPSGLDAPVDCIGAEPDLDQLQAADDPVLPLSKQRDRRIPVARSTFAANSAVNVDLAAHTARIGLAVLRRCANCHW